uniref:C-C motif chemokine n=1 Tax=Poecilia mexicana TaxID=48701 RepID=A0A3B3XV47_9TELE
MRKAVVNSIQLIIHLCRYMVKKTAEGKHGPDECCFEFFRNRLNKRLITSYYRTDARCRTNGIILITRRARRICVDSKDQWVQNIIKSLERKTL